MFRIEALPAENGDCLWIEYGEGKRPHRVLVDGGTAPTYDLLAAHIRRLPPSERRFELLIISHIDADHIQGIVRLLQDSSLRVDFGDIWFNGWRHLTELLSPLEGEYLSALLDAGGYRWNAAFDHGPVVVPPQGMLPQILLLGGMRITLLSPTPKELERLRLKWEKVVQESGLAPGDGETALKKLRQVKRLLPPMLLGGELPDVRALASVPFVKDRAVANGSSIAVLLEYGAGSCLLAADAFPDVLAHSIGRFLNERGGKVLPVSLLKVPHHGSKSNVSTQMLAQLQCDKYLFSTNGNVFNHPDPEAVARVIMHGGPASTLYFNYRTEENEIWENSKLRAMYSYGVKYPSRTKEGIVMSV